MVAWEFAVLFCDGTSPGGVSGDCGAPSYPGNVAGSLGSCVKRNRNEAHKMNTQKRDG